MNLDSLNKWLTLVANLGVLIGIVVVAIELQQTQTQMVAESSTTRAQMANELRVLQDELNVVETNAKLRSGEELSSVEIRSSSTAVHNLLRYFENLHFQYQLGVLDDEIWQANLNSLRRICTGENTFYKYLYPNGFDADSFRESFRELLNPPCP